jgi:hypothetical protein
LYDIADILAFEDRGAYLYVAGDCTRSYSPEKTVYFTRQILFLRPCTFIIFDRVRSRDPSFKKTWLLQAMKIPTRTAEHLVITNGKGRLFVQTLLPRNPVVVLVSGSNLYTYGGKAYPPQQDTGPAPECRIEISPSQQAAADCFLHVLTAVDADVTSVEKATVRTEGQKVTITIGTTQITFTTAEVAGGIRISGRYAGFADGILAEPTGSFEK